MNVPRDLRRHPCFNEAAKGSFGRVHLPVAVHCNIRCNYCDRKFDCVNESRPGVTSAVLSPVQACRYMEKILEYDPKTAVAGIAGPGDPFANPDETMETLRLVREKFPHMLLCLSTNGLAIADYLDEIVKIGVSHVTITVNAVDPQIGQKIYSWVRDGKVIYRGIRGAALLLDRQIAAIEGLKKGGVTVKANTIVVPGVNDGHVEQVAGTLAGLGVDIHNCMPMYPNTDTPFEDIEEPGKELIDAVREKAGRYLPQMLHCTRCRADAAGLLGNDGNGVIRGFLTQCAGLSSDPAEKPYVAVATMEGILVNQHLGEAYKLQIWSKTEEGFYCVGERMAPEPGGGISRWMQLAEILKDCRAVLVVGIGENPSKVLTRAGIRPIEINGFIEAALAAVYSGLDLNEFKRRRKGCCSKGFSCPGSGDEC
jgi:nitrogen fixation protein NifB